jgi:hypothetical protein
MHVNIIVTYPGCFSTLSCPATMIDLSVPEEVSWDLWSSSGLPPVLWRPLVSVTPSWDLWGSTPSGLSTALWRPLVSMLPWALWGSLTSGPTSGLWRPMVSKFPWDLWEPAASETSLALWRPLASLLSLDPPSSVLAWDLCDKEVRSGLRSFRGWRLCRNQGCQGITRPLPTC